jgi:hypothetical protein
VHDYKSEIWENNVFCLYILNNYNDDGIDVTYCYSYGKNGIVLLVVNEETSRCYRLAIHINHLLREIQSCLRS